MTAIKEWMNQHFLKLNADKTEVLLITSPSLSRSLRLPTFELAGAQVNVASAVRDRGVTLDSNMKLDQHVNNVVKCSYMHLSQISRIHRYLTADATKSLVHALVISRVDYCNVLFYGLPITILGKLQRLQNQAARVISGVHKFDH